MEHVCCAWWLYSSVAPPNTRQGFALCACASRPQRASEWGPCALCMNYISIHRSASAMTSVTSWCHYNWRSTDWNTVLVPSVTFAPIPSCVTPTVMYVAHFSQSQLLTFFPMSTLYLTEGVESHAYESSAEGAWQIGHSQQAPVMNLLRFGAHAALMGPKIEI